MMTDAALAAALTSLFSLGLLLILLRLHRDYSVDRFRHEMFTLRDEMFDFAASGDIAFRHPAYGMLRVTMNGFVRWADELSLLSVLLFGLASRRDLRECDLFGADWRRALDGLDAAAQDRMNGFRDRMHEILAAYLVLRSPVFGGPLVGSLAAWAPGRRLTNFAVSRAKAPFAGMDFVALQYGRSPATADGWPSAAITAPTRSR